MKMKMFMLTAVAAIAFTMMSFTSDDSIVVPESLQKEVLNIAVTNNAITQKDADALIEYNAAQRCLDVFIKSNFNVQATVDEIAKISVEAGYYSSVDVAKAGIKANAEALRKDENNWALLYKMLGL